MAYDNYGFSDEFDPGVNSTTQFTKRYRASIMQTKEEMIEMNKLSPIMQNFAKTSIEYQRKHPVVSVKMTNASLDTLLQDFERLTQFEQFFRCTPEMHDAFMKFCTWKAISE